MIAYLVVGAAFGLMAAVWTFLALGNSPLKDALFTAFAAFVLVTLLWLPLLIIIITLNVWDRI